MRFFKSKEEKEKERVEKMRREGDVEGLIRALGSEYPEVCGAAVDALVDLGDKRAVPAIIETLLNPAKPIDVHIRCAVALGVFEDKRALEPLLEAIDDIRLMVYPAPERPFIPKLIAAVACALGHLQDPRAYEALCRFLDHENAVVRWFAAKGLGRIGDERALEKLRKALELEEDENTKKAIAEAINELEGRSTKEEEALPSFEPKEDEDALLKEKGFVPIVEVLQGLRTKIFWHPKMRFELAISKVGESYLVKGMKKYYVKAVSEAGKETWDRNLGQLMDTLRVMFPEFHLYMAGVMRVTKEMVPEEPLLREMEREWKEAEKEAKRLEREMRRQEAEIRDKQAILLWKAERSEDLYKISQERMDLKLLEEGHKTLQRFYEMTQNKIAESRGAYIDLLSRHLALVREYCEKGAATCFVIAYSTVLRKGGKSELRVLVEQTMDEIHTAHKHGSFLEALRNLHIHYEEVMVPWVTHVAEYVGILSPAQLEGQEEILKEVLPFFMLTGIEDIKVGDEVVEEGKKTPARTFQAFLRRVRAISEQSLRIPELPKAGGWIGNLVLGSEVTDIPVFFPLDKLYHGYISGTTGSGKTFLARVLVENAILEGVNVVVLDRTRQWTGLIKPMRNEGALARLKKLGLEENLSTGFPARVWLVKDVKRFAEEFARDIEKAMEGCVILSLKGLSDKEACAVAKLVLEAAYYLADKETEKLKRLVVIEEAHAFLPGHVDPSAKEEAQEVRRLIDRISREKRKYGLNLLLISQSLSDFKEDARIVREMCNTKFFMRATDRAELEYIASYVSPEAAEAVKWLKDGEALLRNPNFEPVKVLVRPPFSHVGEVKEEEVEPEGRLRRAKEEFLLKVREVSEASKALSGREEELLLVVKKYYEEEGKPIPVSELSELLGLEGGTRQRLLEKLERKGLIKLVDLEAKGRGRPRKGILPLV